MEDELADFFVEYSFKYIILIARDLISSNIPQLKCSDTGQKALEIMELFKVNHLPLLKDDEYVGLIAEQDIYDNRLEMCRLDEGLNIVFNPYIKASQHIFEVVQAMMRHKLSVLPVLEMDGDYLGVIVIHDLASNLIDLVSAHEPGAIIVLELSPADYSLSQIAQIVESNDAKVLSLYVNNPENSIELDVTIKVNVSDVSSIVETFVRFDYNIKAVYMDDSSLHDMYNERYDLFMKYLNI